ncbi:hypothetical protein HDV02_004880 [Globomyces sp. JEL0801]|nr:hypothetical protein HDV02_004880 [Globomyces sp. JEL0801]
MSLSENTRIKLLFMLFSWDTVLKINVESLIEESESFQDELYHCLVSTSLDLDDENATTTNLTHVFRLTQMLLQAKNNLVSETNELLKTKEIQLRDQDIELKRFRAFSKSNSTAFDTRVLQEEIIQLERKNERTARDLESTEEALEKERELSAAVQAAADNDKNKVLTLQDTIKKVEAELRECRLQLTSQKGRLQVRNTDEEAHKTVISQKNEQIANYIEEIRMITTEKNQLELDKEELTVELTAAFEELEYTQKELESIKNYVTESDKQVDQLTDERDALRIKVEDLSDQLESSLKKKDLITINLKKEVIELEDEISVIKGTISSHEHTIGGLETTIKRLKSNDQAQQLELLKEQINSKELIIVDQRTKLASAAKDFELLAQDWNKLEQQLNSRNENQERLEKAKSEFTTIGKLREKILVLTNAHKQDSKKLESVTSEIAEKELEILQLKSVIEKYEQGFLNQVLIIGYDMTEALKELKMMKGQKAILERDIVHYTQKLSDLEAQENYAIRSESGLGPSTLDFTNFKQLKVIELEKEKSLNLSLRKEIEQLEEERLELKSRLRLQALERGERAIKLGLDAQDLLAVEDYVEKLRTGSKENPINYSSSKPTFNIENLDKIVGQLEKSYIELAETRERLDLREKEIKEVQNECETFRAAMVKISGMMMESQDENNLTFCNNVEIQTLLTLLTSKTVRHVDGVQTALDKVQNATNESLRKQLEKAKHEITLLKEKINENEHTQKQNIFNNATLEADLKNAKEYIIQLEAKKLLKTPSETMIGDAVGFGNVVDQLIDCLIELDQTKENLLKANGLIDDYRAKYMPLTVNARMLYRDMSNMKKLHEQEKKEFQHELNKLELERDTLSVTVKTLEKTIEQLKLNPDEIQGQLVQAQRKLIVLKVNEVSLNRLQAATCSNEKMLINENKKLRQTLDELDKTSALAITRMYRDKRQAMEKIESLFSTLENSIPLTNYKSLQDKLDIVISKNKNLLDREQDLIQFHLSLQTREHDFIALAQRNYDLELKLGNKSIPSGSLEVQVELLKKKLQLAEEKTQSSVQSEIAMKTQLEFMEQLYLKSKEEMLELQQEHFNTLSQLENAISGEDYAKMKIENEALSQAILNLQREKDKAVSISDIATQQASHLRENIRQDKSEIETLRSAMKELQMTDDQKLIIGQLNQHILQLQKNEANVNQENKDLKSKCLRLENTILQIQLLKIQEQANSLEKLSFDFRLKTKSRLQLLHTRIADLRQRATGAVTLERYEVTEQKLIEYQRVSVANKRLFDIKESLDKALHTMALEKMRVEDNLQKLGLQENLQNELLKALESPSKIEQRIRVWHEKMVFAQSEALKLQRELDKAKDSSGGFEKDFRDLSKRTEELEDQLLQLQSDHDIQLLDWEKQQNEFELTISQFEEERDRIYISASSVEMRDALPDRTLPIGEQLESSLRLLMERTRQVSLLNKRIMETESKCIQKNDQLQNAVNALNESNLQLDKLKLERDQWLHSSRAPKPTTDAIELEKKYNDKSRNREARALQFAQETLMSLQRQVAQKDEMVEKYRKMLSNVRKECAEKATENGHILKANLKIEEMTLREIHRYNLEPSQLIQETKSGIIEEEMKIISELQRLDIAIATAESSIKDLKEQLRAQNSKSSDQINEMKSIVLEKEDEITRLKIEYAQLNTEMKELQERLNAPPVPDLTDVVTRLENDIANKDSKLASSAKAIQKLKNQLMSMSKELAMKSIVSENNVSSSEHSLRNEVQLLVEKVKDLELKNKRLVDANVRLKKEHEINEIDLERTTNELIQKNCELSKFKAQANSNTSTPTHIGMKTSPTDSINVSSNGNLSWETEKKFKRRIEILKDTLKEKTIELQKAVHSLNSLKESHTRSEKDRLKLQNRLKKLSAAEISKESDEIMQMREKIKELQNTLTRATSLKAALTKKPTPDATVLQDSNCHNLFDSVTYSGNENDKKALLNKTNDELINIILHLTRKLNGDIKPNDSNTEVYKQLSESTSQIKKLKAELKAARQAAEESSESLSAIIKYDEIVELRKVIGSVDSSVKIEEEKQLNRLNEELTSIKHKLLEKDRLIEELMNPDKNEGAKIISENRRMKREMEMLNVRLSKLSKTESGTEVLQKENRDLLGSRKIF